MALIKDNFEQARSHEEMREKTVTLTMTIASIMTASLGVGQLAASSIPFFCTEAFFQTVVGIMLFILGIFGALCSQKHYERNRMHIVLAQRYLEKLKANGIDYPFDVIEEFKIHVKEKTGKHRGSNQ